MRTVLCAMNFRVVLEHSVIRLVYHNMSIDTVFLAHGP